MNRRTRALARSSAWQTPSIYAQHVVFKPRRDRDALGEIFDGGFVNLTVPMQRFNCGYVITTVS